MSACRVMVPDAEGDSHSGGHSQQYVWMPRSVLGGVSVAGLFVKLLMPVPGSVALGLLRPPGHAARAMLPAGPSIPVFTGCCRAQESR